jgi:hypothetical protein
LGKKTTKKHVKKKNQKKRKTVATVNIPRVLEYSIIISSHGSWAGPLNNLYPVMFVHPDFRRPG